VVVGKASDLGGDGYPCRYALMAGVLKVALQSGVPAHNGPMVIGDDYCLPAGRTGSARIDGKRLSELDPDTLLSIEAWDQSLLASNTRSKSRVPPPAGRTGERLVEIVSRGVDRITFRITRRASNTGS
jgi:hypothetical protein